MPDRVEFHAIQDTNPSGYGTFDEWNLKTAMSLQVLLEPKSIGEIVINTPAPAIAHAIYRATGVWHRELPITPEKILMSMPEE